MKFLSSFVVAAFALTACVAASTPASVESAAIFRRASSDLSNLETGKPPSSQSQGVGAVQREPQTPTECFAAIDGAVNYLNQSQATSDPSKPPDFSEAEKGLVKLSMLLRHCTLVIKNGPVFTAQEDKYAQGNLLDMRKVIIVITDRIKKAKAYSDKYNYTFLIVTILDSLTTQMYNLEQALVPKVQGPAGENLPSVLIDIVCVMSGTIRYLGGKSPIDESICTSCGNHPPTCSWDQFKKCPTPMPKPTPPKCATDCGGCAATGLQWMYQNNAWNNHNVQACSHGMPPAPSCNWEPVQPFWSQCTQQHGSAPGKRAFLA